ncbi:MAG: hypothetical protein ABW185_13760 [Sedimenticola sp.]
MSRRDTPNIKTLPPTDYALNKHIKRARSQPMIWKAADQLEPTNVDISLYDWVVNNGVPIPSTVVSKVAPPELMLLPVDVVHRVLERSSGVLYFIL